jgi:DNA-binding response OmpR family regulator
MVTANRKLSKLTTTEALLFAALYNAHGEIVSQDTLARISPKPVVKRPGMAYRSGGVVRMHLHHIRAHLKMYGVDPRCIVTYPGKGTAFIPRYDISFDPITKTVTSNGRQAQLTRTEAQLFAKLYYAPRKIFSKDELARIPLDHPVKNPDMPSRNNGTVRVLIHHIRTHLRMCGVDPKCIMKHDDGYSFTQPTHIVRAVRAA